MALFTKAWQIPQTLLFIAILCSSTNANESANWIIGIGAGAGVTQSDMLYSGSSQNRLGITWRNWGDRNEFSEKSWGVAYELLVGYKHFINEYVGFRYYANVGAQHFKDAIFSDNKDKIGVVEYTLNADLLLNFYESHAFSFGIFGGFGVGGAYFDSPTLKDYEMQWGGVADSPNFTQAVYNGENAGEVYRHHFSASISAGARINIFQQIRNAGQLVCKDRGDGRRSCSKPSAHLEHSLEFSAKFPMLTYKATKSSDVMGAYCIATPETNPDWVGKYKCSWQRPAFTIKTPYKFLLRYIIAF